MSYAHDRLNGFTVDWLSIVLGGLFLGFQVGALTLAHYLQSLTFNTPTQSTNIALGGQIILLAAVEIGILLAGWRAYKRLPERWRNRIAKTLKYGLLVGLYYVTFYLYYLNGQAIEYVVFVTVAGGFSVWVDHSEFKWLIFNLMGLGLGVVMVTLASFQLAPIVVLVLMVAFLIYDHIAVNLSGIMASLIDFSASTGIPNYVVIPSTIRFDLAPLREFMTDERDEKPENIALLIGVGDFVFPSLLVVSAFVTHGMGLIVGTTIVGTVIAAIVLRDSLERAESGLPALPWLNTGAIGGFFLGALVSTQTLVGAVGL